VWENDAGFAPDFLHDRLPIPARPKDHPESYLTDSKETVMERTLTAVLHKEGDLFVANCPEVGTVSQGATIEEALGNLKEATELYMEEFPVGDTPHPLVTSFEVAVNA